jgi:hypothetical protein
LTHIQLKTPVRRHLAEGEKNMTNGLYGNWKAFPGKSHSTLALPDYNSNYFAYGFDWKKNQSLGLLITGDFGYARYMSYNIYGAVSGTSKGAVTDINIDPLPGNVNPFCPGESATALNRKYSVTVFCQDNASPMTLALPNPLKFTNISDGTTPKDDLTMLVVILRYYLPTDGDIDADAAPPTIEAFDIVTNRPLPLPDNIIPQMPTELYQEQLKPIFQTAVDNTLRFYRVAGGGQFNNADNLYLMNAFDKRSDEVLILKFQPPTYGVNNDQYPCAQVRYWSFNQGNPDTSTPAGIPDEGFQMAKDGFIYIAISDPNQKVADWAKQGGYNFMPWAGETNQGVIVYRNLVTNSTLFKDGDMCQVDVLSGLKKDHITGKDDPRITDMDATNYIGSYAPSGKKVTQAEFLKNYGGMPSPGFKTP